MVALHVISENKTISKTQNTIHLEVFRSSHIIYNVLFYVPIFYFKHHFWRFTYYPNFL